MEKMLPRFIRLLIQPFDVARRLREIARHRAPRRGPVFDVKGRK